jgi:hypothetical protein
MANFQVQNPAAELVQGLGSLMEAFAPQKPSASEVNEQVKSKGTTLASQHIAQYQRISETKGLDKADAWLNTQAVKAQSNLGATGAESYRTTIKSFLGGIPMNQELEAQRSAQAAEETQRRNAIELGRELTIASGANIENFSEEDLYLRGQAYEGRTQINQLQKQQFELQSSRLRAEEMQLEANTRQGIDQYAATFETEMDARVQEYATAVAQNNGTSVELKANLITDLRALRANLSSELRGVVQENGGSWSQVSTQDVARLENMLDNTEKLIQGEYLVDLQKIESTRILMGQASEFLQMNEDQAFVTRLGLSQLPGVQTARVNITGADVSNVQGGAGGVLERNILKRAMSGIGAASVQEGATPEQATPAYRAAGKTLGSFKSTDPEYQKTSAAEFFVNSLFEGTTGRRKVRSVTNSRGGVPLMLKEAANMERGALAQEILAEAESEGKEPREVFSDYYNELIRGTLVPSLRINDEDFIQSVQVQDNNGRISLTFDRDMYNQRVRGNRTGRQGMIEGVESAALDQHIKRIRQLEAELNKYAGAYTHIMDADPTDVTTAMVSTLQTAARMASPEEIQRMQQDQSQDQENNDGVE